jgi:hypothetical protein
VVGIDLSERAQLLLPADATMSQSNLAFNSITVNAGSTSSIQHHKIATTPNYRVKRVAELLGRSQRSQKDAPAAT